MIFTFDGRNGFSTVKLKREKTADLRQSGFDSLRNLTNLS